MIERESGGPEREGGRCSHRILSSGEKNGVVKKDECQISERGKCIWTYVCMCVCVRLCVYMCAFVCLCVRIRMHG